MSTDKGSTDKDFNDSARVPQQTDAVRYLQQQQFSPAQLAQMAEKDRQAQQQQLQM